MTETGLSLLYSLVKSVDGGQSAALPFTPLSDCHWTAVSAPDATASTSFGAQIDAGIDAGIGAEIGADLIHEIATMGIYVDPSMRPPPTVSPLG